MVSQLFYYENISLERTGGSCPAIVPYLASWGEEEITEREKREKELGGYGFGEVYIYSVLELYNEMKHASWCLLSCCSWGR